ncbi:MAG TPA: hypothetical protein VF733_03055 [Candidatus Saccharimonadales bacterium]
MIHQHDTIPGTAPVEQTQFVPLPEQYAGQLDPHNANRTPFTHNRFDQAPVNHLARLSEAQFLNQIQDIVGEDEVRNVLDQGGTQGAESYLAEVRAQARDAVLNKALRARGEDQNTQFGPKTEFKSKEEMSRFSPLYDAVYKEVREKLTTMTPDQVLAESQRPNLAPGYAVMVKERVSELAYAQARQQATMAATRQPRITNVNVPNARNVVHPATHPGQPTQPHRQTSPPLKGKVIPHPGQHRIGSLVPPTILNPNITQPIPKPNIAPQPQQNPNVLPHGQQRPNLPTPRPGQGHNTQRLRPNTQQSQSQNPNVHRQHPGNTGNINTPSPINPNRIQGTLTPNQNPAPFMTPDEFKRQAGKTKKGARAAAQRLSDTQLEQVIAMADASRKHKIYTEQSQDTKLAESILKYDLEKMQAAYDKANAEGRDDDREQIYQEMVRRQAYAFEPMAKAADKAREIADTIPYHPGLKIGSKEMSALLDERARRANARRSIEQKFQPTAHARDQHIKNLQAHNGIENHETRQTAAVARQEYLKFLGVAEEKRGLIKRLRRTPKANLSLKGMDRLERAAYNEQVLNTLDPATAFETRERAQKIYARLSTKHARDVFNQLYQIHYGRQGKPQKALWAK